MRIRLLTLGAMTARSSGGRTTAGTTYSTAYVRSSSFALYATNGHIRNTRPSTTFDDLSRLRWKCGTCEERHTGPCLDFGFSEPFYWNTENDAGSRWAQSPQDQPRSLSPTFLDADYCSIEGESFFVRGLIHLQIIGAAESLRWGVWGSLSRENFEKLLGMDEQPQRVDLPPMFSWLSSKIEGYADTLSLKMYLHVQEPGTRPHFRLERSDHPLSIDYHHDITPERVREIMFRSLPENES